MQKIFYLGLKKVSNWVPEKFLSGSQKNFYLGLGKISIWDPTKFLSGSISIWVLKNFYMGLNNVFMYYHTTRATYSADKPQTNHSRTAAARSRTQPHASASSRHAATP